MRSEKEQTKAIYKAIAERVFHFNYEKILVYFYYNFCLMSRMCAMSKTGCGADDVYWIYVVLLLRLWWLQVYIPVTVAWSQNKNMRAYMFSYYNDKQYFTSTA